ncbi:MAG: hypothetical protein HYX96_00225, partial [Chloroflexi bacterium]|nr:hypothetical protein [Chloroflexota bacterium]
ETAEAAIRAVDRASEIAKLAARQATDVWVRTFAEAVNAPLQGSRMPREVAEAREARPRPTPPVVNAAGTEGSAPPRETRQDPGEKPPVDQKTEQARRLIEKRLDFLTRMYTSSKETGPDEEEAAG